MAKRPGQKQWLQRQRNDPFVKASKVDGYRSRASYKLLELHNKYQILRKGMKVVDLGAAPGGWSQVIAKLILPQGKLMALDILPMAPIPYVDFIQGDFTEDSVHEQLTTVLGSERGLDWVFSDLAPNLTGLVDVDQANSLELLEKALMFAKQHLKSKGGFLVKAFQGQGTDEYVSLLKKSFDQVLIKKPVSSRAESREIYLLARGYNI